jgi:hypothetical protein
MGLINRIFGNSAESDTAAAAERFEDLLIDGEQLLSAHKLVRDVLLLTSLRLVFVDKQGITGKKTEFLSIPYRSVIRFAVETAGHLDIDAELKVWVAGDDEAMVWDFGSSKDAVSAQRHIASAILRLQH